MCLSHPRLFVCCHHPQAIACSHAGTPSRATRSRHTAQRSSAGLRRRRNLLCLSCATLSSVPSIHSHCVPRRGTARLHSKRSMGWWWIQWNLRSIDGLPVLDYARVADEIPRTGREARPRQHGVPEPPNGGDVHDSRESCAEGGDMEEAVVGKKGGDDGASAGILHGCCVCEVKENGEQQYLTRWHRDSLPDGSECYVKPTCCRCSSVVLIT